LAGGGAEVPPYAPFADRRPLLVLAGGDGREGKSLSAAWILAQRDGRWTTCSELAQTAIAKYDRDVYLSPEVLVLDDVGAESLTEWVKGRVYDVLSDRIANGKRTIVTTNIVEKEVFTARYDERLSRRIAESGRWIKLGKWAS
jgi:hypothetical protein